MYKMTTWFTNVRIEPADGIFIPDSSSNTMTGAFMDASSVTFKTDGEPDVIFSKNGMRFRDSSMNILKNKLILANGSEITTREDLVGATGP